MSLFKIVLGRIFRFGVKMVGVLFEPTADLRKHLRLRFIKAHPKSPWILTRTACLGNDVASIAFPQTPVLRFQKTRIDQLEEILNSGERRPFGIIPFRLKRSIARDDVWPLISRQNQRISDSAPAPFMIIIDSYSELTDQEFKEKKSSSVFFANYSDLRAEDIEAGIIVSNGLIDIGLAEKIFDNFMSAVERRWGPVPTVFLAYPPNLESRQKYLDRSEAIVKMFENLERRWPNAYFLKERLAEIRASEEDAEKSVVFPYHYESGLYRHLANLVLEVADVVGVPA
jgi:hypothetical protein